MSSNIKNFSRASKKLATLLVPLALTVGASMPIVSAQAANQPNGEVTVSKKPMVQQEKGKVSSKRVDRHTSPPLTKKMRAKLRHSKGAEAVAVRAASTGISAASGGGSSYTFSQGLGGCDTYLSGTTSKYLSIPAPAVYAADYSGQWVAWQVRFYVGSTQVAASNAYYAQAYSTSAARFPYGSVSYSIVNGSRDQAFRPIRAVAQVWWQSPSGSWRSSAWVDPMPQRVRTYQKSAYNGSWLLIANQTMYAC